MLARELNAHQHLALFFDFTRKSVHFSNTNSFTLFTLVNANFITVERILTMIDQFTPIVVKNTALRIDYLRAQNNFTYRDLAKKSGVSLATIHNIIQGNKVPNIYTLHNICNALGISLSDFFDFDDEVIRLRGKENILIKIYREVSPMSQDTLIKVAKCMK